MNEKVKNLFRSYLFDGLLLVGLGVVVLIWPEESLNVLCIIMGASVALMGLIKFIVFFTTLKKGGNAYDIFVGILQIALGVAMITNTSFFIDSFQIITGVILVYCALVMLIRAFTLRGVKGSIFILSIIFALLTIALAVIIFINPSTFASVMMRIQGGTLIISGIFMFVVTLNVKKAVQDQDQRRR